MITSKEFVQAQQVFKCIIEVVFDVKYTNHFKETILSRNGWSSEDYTIERCHASGHHFRITLLHDDGREKDVYVSGEDVFDWYEYIGNNLDQF